MRRFFLIVLFATSLLTNQNVFGADQGEIERLRTQQICNWKAESVLNQMRWIYDNWIDKKSSFAVAPNFKKVLVLHKQFFESTKNFSRFLPLKLNSLDELSDARAQLETEYRNSHKLFAEVDLADLEFSQSAANVEVAIESVRRDATILKSECPEYKKQGEIAEKSTKSWSKGVNNYRSYIDQAKQKRMGLFDSVYHLAVQGINKALTNLAVDKLSQTKQQLMESLELDAFHTKVETWWTNTAIINGIGGGLQTKYLQFTPALRVMAADIGRTLIFERELKKFPDNPIKTRIAANLSAYRNQIETEMNRVKSLGWRAQMDRQIVLSRARAAKSPNKLCTEAIGRHLEMASSTQDAEHFAVTEALYAYSVRACSVQRASK